MKADEVDYVISRQAFSQNWEKRLLVLSCLSGFNWTDFPEILYWNIFWKSVKKIQLSLKSDKNNAFRSQWPRYLKRRSAAARLLRLRFRIPPGAWVCVCCKCRVFAVKILCDELISLPEEFCRLWCVVMCDLEASRMKRPWLALECSATKKNNNWYRTGRGHAVTQLVKALRYKPEGSGFDSRWCHWNFSLT